MDLGSIMFCLSPYSLEFVVYRHCLAPLCSFKMNKTFKWLTPLPILTQKSFQSDSAVLGIVFPSSTSWDLTLWRQLSYQSIKRMNEQCYRSVKRMKNVTDQSKEWMNNVINQSKEWTILLINQRNELTMLLINQKNEWMNNVINQSKEWMNNAINQSKE